jgi:hypothetical protein
MHAFAAAAVTTNSLQDWIKSNVIPLLILIIAVSLFSLSRKGNNAKSIQVVGGVVIALAVLGLATAGTASSVGTSIWTTVTGL